MRKTAVYTLFTFFAGLCFAGASLAAGEYGKSEKQDQALESQSQQQLGQQGQQARQPGMEAAGMLESRQQIKAASDIQEFDVQTATGESLGKVDQVVLDLEQGQIGYVIVDAGEGEGKYIIPWNALRSQPEQQNLVVNLTQEQFQQAPKGEIEQVFDRQKGQEIHQFYGVAPYWESTGIQPQRDMMQDRMQRERMPQDQMHRDMMQQREMQPETQQPATPTEPGR